MPSTRTACRWAERTVTRLTVGSWALMACRGWQRRGLLGWTQSVAHRWTGDGDLGGISVEPQSCRKTPGSTWAEETSAPRSGAGSRGRGSGAVRSSAVLCLHKQRGRAPVRLHALFHSSPFGGLMSIRMARLNQAFRLPWMLMEHHPIAEEKIQNLCCMYIKYVQRSPIRLDTQVSFAESGRSPNGE